MVLAEIYIMFEVIGFIFLITGIDDEKRRVIFPAVSMIMFFSLAVQGAAIESIFTGTTVESTESIMFNYMFGIVSFLYLIFAILSHFKQGLVDHKSSEDF